jgi:predicted transcriptional regulator
MANKKTIAQRILHAATKENKISTPVLRRRMRIPTTEMSQELFNNSIMRSARDLASKGMLKRTDRGEYKITKKGIKAMA